MRYHKAPTKAAKKNKTDHTSVDKEVEQLKLLYTVEGNIQ